MSNSRPKSIASLIGNKPDTLIERLVAQRSDNDTLFSYLKTQLSSDEAKHIVAISVRDMHLLIVADSAAWANIIRYKAQALLKQLHATDTKFGKIDPRSFEKIIVRTSAAEFN